jgi:spore maturation protein CgeB
MKILYVGEIYASHYGTCQLRMGVLRSLGHEVIPLCTIPFLSWGGRYGGVLFRRLLWGPPIWQLNKEIARQIVKFKPDVLWVDKGRQVTPATLQIARMYSASAIHFTPDPAITFHRSRHFAESIRHYDLIVTSKSYELDLYKKYGARRVLFQMPAFDEHLHQPIMLSVDEQQRYGADAVFVGTYGKGREKYLAPLASLNIDLAVWGGYWERCQNKYLRSRTRGDTRNGIEYSKALCGAKIGLGILSPLVPDKSTTRSLEIPACGTFLLAERTQEHQLLFKEGIEAEFFSSPEELKQKITHYLKDENARTRVAAKGRDRCLKSEYSYKCRIEQILREIPSAHR